MQVWKDYQQQHKDRFLNELLDLLRIPSVSAKSEHKDDMITCANSVKEHLLKAGATTATIYETVGHPVVYGEKIFDTTFKPRNFFSISTNFSSCFSMSTWVIILIVSSFIKSFMIFSIALLFFTLFLLSLMRSKI